MQHTLLTTLIATAIATTTAINTSAQDNINVRVALDSAYIEMGRTTTLHVQVSGVLSPNGGIITPDTLWKDVEVASITEPVIVDLGNGRKELTQDVIIQAFDSGLYTLPPVLYIQDSFVAQSNTPALKVLPVPVDSMTTIHDFAPIEKPARHFFDFLPDWMTDFGLWILLAIIVISAALFIYMRYIRKGKMPLMPKKKVIPPYEFAIMRLQHLRNLNLCERGEEKEYYTQLTDILRTYLDARFGINAMEMTSSQIRQALNQNEETKLPKKHMEAVLETADFVKFAKVRPLPDDNVAAFRAAMQFVEDTKPLPDPTPDQQLDQHNNNDTKNSKTEP